MTKEEAKAALKDGKKVTHVFMTSEEWVMVDPVNPHKYKFEDGVSQDIDSFWGMRPGEGWLDGWEIVNEK